MITDVSTPRLNGEVGVLSTLRPSHNRSSSDDGFLSPRTLGRPRRTSLDVPCSPSPTDISSDDSSTTVPPSLTLSNGPSDHFIPTLAFRDKTLGDLLNPTDQSNSKTHHCEDSNATFASSSEEIEADHGNDIHLQHAQLNTTGMTYVEPSCTKRGNMDPDMVTALSEARKQEMSSAGEVNPEHLDPTPFAFKPCELAQMLDSKNLEHLESLGGPQGQFRGLGKTQRLSTEDKVLVCPYGIRLERVVTSVLLDPAICHSRGPTRSQHYSGSGRARQGLYLLGLPFLVLSILRILYRQRMWTTPRFSNLALHQVGLERDSLQPGTNWLFWVEQVLQERHISTIARYDERH